MSVERPSQYLSLKSFDDLMRCVNLASLFELIGWPKPGNVHRRKDFENTKFEHFIAGITAIQPNFRAFCERIFKFSFHNDKDYEELQLGYFFKKATEQMIKWQTGGNVILGHILILAPLVAAATICLKTGRFKLKDFMSNISQIIDHSTVDDTLNLYEAIGLCNPGGLGKVEKYDITNENSIREIKEDNINLKQIFELSKERDLICSEYSTGFHIILNEGLPFFLDIFNQCNNINISTVNTFLKILSDHPDTLIIRKSGIKPALKVSRAALKIVKYGGISSKKGAKLTIKLDNELHKHKGNLNPGTTADLISGVIFCALILGLKV